MMSSSNYHNRDTKLPQSVNMAPPSSNPPLSAQPRTLTGLPHHQSHYMVYGQPLGQNLMMPQQQQQQLATMNMPASQSNPRKRRRSDELDNLGPSSAPSYQFSSSLMPENKEVDPPPSKPKVKKTRVNIPWTPGEEQKLKRMRDNQNTWNEIAKEFPARTEGSVKKHWYKDMHYAEFAENDSATLLAAIKDYEASKWKVIGQKVGKPAKACEQYAKEHFQGKF